jgi:hypothetical protein
VLLDARGSRIELPYDRNLWEGAQPGSDRPAIVAPVDPALYGIDPLNFMPT